MLPNQIIQKTIQDIRRITGLSCSVWNTRGECLAMTCQVSAGLGKRVMAFTGENIQEQIEEKEGMFLSGEEGEHTCVLVLSGVFSDLAMAGRFGVSQLTSLLEAYKERMDKNRFMQKLILNHLLRVDIYNQAKKMKISAEQRRVVFLIEPKQDEDNLILETLKGLYATGNKDFVTAVDEDHVILIKALEKTEAQREIAHIADVLVDTLNMEAMVSVRVSYGTVVDELTEISRSYKEAMTALEVGRVFYEERNILAYRELGIGRLIHQLPTVLCKMFLDEVFAGNGAEQFEEEELATVYTFFENNLNISETARQLYVHRNTLVYRLEKIQKRTGLDVRVFEDALTFKIAMMVESHIRHSKEVV